MQLAVDMLVRQGTVSLKQKNRHFFTVVPADDLQENGRNLLALVLLKETLLELASA